MVSCSTLVIIRKHSDYAVGGLMGVVVTQALGYGLIFDLNFFLRNLSVIGGLIMVLSDSWAKKTKAFAGLPQLDEKDRKMYFQLAGRVLLIFLFIGFVFSGKWTIWRVIVSGFGAIACVMVVVGFKAKFSATLLVVILSGFNLLVNNFWTVSALHHNPSNKHANSVRAAPRTPPPQGLRQVRLLPSPLYCRWAPTTRQQRPRPVQHRREEEGLLRGGNSGGEEWRASCCPKSRVGATGRMGFGDGTIQGLARLFLFVSTFRIGFQKSSMGFMATSDGRWADLGHFLAYT